MSEDDILKFKSYPLDTYIEQLISRMSAYSYCSIVYDKRDSDLDYFLCNILKELKKSLN